MFKRQAREKLATINIKDNQSIHRQVTEIMRLVGVAFMTLADADKQTMTLKQFTWPRKVRAFKGNYRQCHLLL